MWRRHYDTGRAGAFPGLVAIGRSIILKHIKGDFYRQKCGTAPSYKSWTWAIVDPRTREPIRKKEDICFQPTPSELQRCAALGEWWASVASAQDLGTVHQIRPVRTGRIHRLLSEASPECEPDGFFDCTVEVSEQDPALSSSL